MNAIRNMLSVAWKDLQVIFKNRGLLIIIIGMPLVFGILFGSINQAANPIDKESLKLPVALVNQDEGAYGQQIGQILNSISGFQFSPFSTIDEAEAQVRDSKFLAAVVIPPGLTQNVAAYKPSEIVVIVDPTQKQVASIITGVMKDVVTGIAVQGEISYAIRSLLADVPGFQQADAQTKSAYEAQSIAVEMAQVARMQSDPWVKLEVKNSEGKDIIVVANNYFAMLMPGFAVMFAFFIVGTMGSDLLSERREGTLRRLIAAPLPRWTVIAGKMLAYIVLVLVQVTVLFGIASLAFGMPLGKSLIGIAMIALGTGLAATGMGMMLAALAKSERQADSLGILIGFVLAGLGGCFIIGSPVPLYKSGGVMEIISKLTPHAHALMAYDKLLNLGKGTVDILPQFGILLGFALVFLLVATWRFKYE